MKIFITAANRFVIKNNAVRGVLVAVFWLAVWQVLYLSVKQEILIVSPIRVLQRLGELSSTSLFWLSAGTSMFHILLGFFLAIFIGVLLAILTVWIPFLYQLFYPMLSIIKATPVASFIILAWVWMKSSSVPVFTAFLMVLPVVWGNAYNGIKKTDVSLLELAHCYSFGFLKTVKRVYIPSVMPYFTAACTTGMGLAWKAGIAAEVLAHAANSIGGQIYDAKIYIETADLFAWTAVVILMSVLLEKLMVFVIQKVGKNYNTSLV